jgi:hypothetical protein
VVFLGLFFFVNTIFTTIVTAMVAELDQVLEDRLFKQFKGYTCSERSRNTNSWIWNEGYDIQNTSNQRWVCKTCIQMQRPAAASFNTRPRCQEKRCFLSEGRDR